MTGCRQTTFGTEIDFLITKSKIMVSLKIFMVKNQLLSQVLIFFFMLSLTTFLFSIILKFVIPFLVAFLLTKWFYKWFVDEKSQTEWVNFFSNPRKNNGLF